MTEILVLMFFAQELCFFWTQVHVSDAEWGQTNLKFEAEKGLLQDWARERGGSCPKHPELLKEFQQSLSKGQEREGCLRVCAQLNHDSLIDRMISP